MSFDKILKRLEEIEERAAKATPGPLYRNPVWLAEQYWTHKKSTVEIAQLCGVCHSTILRWMKHHNITRRSISEATWLAERNELVLSPEAIEFLEGHLLGDGCLSPRGKYSASYTQASKYYQYIKWVADQLATLGIEQRGNIQRYETEKGGVIYTYFSRAYWALLQLYHRWYPNGQKRVPKSLELTPTMVRLWFIDDGSLVRRRSDGWQCVQIATCGFSVDEVSYLTDKLSQVLNVSRHHIHIWPSQKGPRIYFGKREVLRAFFNYIGPCPLALRSIWGYKWPQDDI